MGQLCALSCSSPEAPSLSLEMKQFRCWSQSCITWELTSPCCCTVFCLSLVVLSVGRMPCCGRWEWYRWDRSNCHPGLFAHAWHVTHPGQFGRKKVVDDPVCDCGLSVSPAADRPSSVFPTCVVMRAQSQKFDDVCNLADSFLCSAEKPNLQRNLKRVCW